MKKYGLMKRETIISTGSFKTKKTLKRINQLIKDIERNGYMEGIGNPEPLLSSFLYLSISPSAMDSLM